MANHEFEIMPVRPRSGQRYDEYDPEKYNCVSIADDDLAPFLELLSDISFSWHAVDIRKNGLAYCGVTLISPSSGAKMLSKIEGVSAFAPLAELLKRAISENKYVIHFGI